LASTLEKYDIFIVRTKEEWNHFGINVPPGDGDYVVGVGFDETSASMTSSSKSTYDAESSVSNNKRSKSSESAEPASKRQRSVSVH
jgi:hypothetical protein